jgi:hypothetical protein
MSNHAANRLGCHDRLALLVGASGFVGENGMGLDVIGMGCEAGYRV